MMHPGMMHPDRKFTVLVFALSCAATAAFSYFAFVFSNWFTIGLFVSSLGTSVFGGYRAFCVSDQSYRVQSLRSDRWMRDHPRLIWLIMILSFAGVIWQLIDLVRDIVR